MNDKQMSSIDWFVEQIHKNLPTYDLLNFDQKLFFNELVKQAKLMHQQEIEEAYGHGQNNGYMYAHQKAITISKENYFNQTFGGQDNEII